MKTIEIKFQDLCEEIDYWKARAKAAEKEVEEWKNRYSDQLNERLESSKKDIANALMFALSVKDDINGNLVIDKESREFLSEKWK